MAILETRPTSEGPRDGVRNEYRASTALDWHTRDARELIAIAVDHTVIGAAAEFVRVLYDLTDAELGRAKEENPRLAEAMQRVVKSLTESAPKDRAAIETLALLCTQANAITGPRNPELGLMYWTAKMELTPAHRMHDYMTDRLWRSGAPRSPSVPVRPASSWPATATARRAEHEAPLLAAAAAGAVSSAHPQQEPESCGFAVTSAFKAYIR